MEAAYHGYTQAEKEVTQRKMSDSQKHRTLDKQDLGGEASIVAQGEKLPPATWHPT